MGEKEKWNNGMKDSTIEELNEEVRRLTEEKKEMKIESDKSIEALELSKKAAEDEYLSEQEVAKEAMRKLEEAMSKEEQHLSSREASKELLESMEGNLSAREEELNDLKRKCVEKEAKLEEMERETVVLSKEKENIEIEMEERVKAMSRREKESSEMMRQSDVKIEEQLETVNKLKNQNRSLKNEISDLRVEMESTAAGLEKELLESM